MGDGMRIVTVGGDRSLSELRHRRARLVIAARWEMALRGRTLRYRALMDGIRAIDMAIRKRAEP